MLFNSYEFLLAFLPITLIVHHLLVTRGHHRATRLWLVAASLFFYAYWFPPYLLLLLGSLVVNYALGRLVADARSAPGVRKAWLVLGLTANLGLLAFFKYAAWLLRNVNGALGLDLPVSAWALPIGISFFTFQQIAYLVDAHRSSTCTRDPVDYFLFISFFPQLIAGPIVHHGEIIPQFRENRVPDAADRAVGLTYFLLGLAKKVLIADTLAPHVDLVFGSVAQGQTPTLLAAWSGLFAFWFQVYFDFSGYSDMAGGLARLVGYRLPVNFDAPYRSDSMIEFWQRWHVTLSRFLRDYLYIPLGGNRRGTVRRYANLVLTMTLGGLWHGAEWTFVMWGFVNGVYLVINNLWRSAIGRPPDHLAYRVSARALTTFSAMVSYVFFRAVDLDDAWTMYRTMAGLGGAGVGSIDADLAWLLFGLFAMSQLAPTSQRWLERYEPVLAQWRDTVRWPEALTWRPTTGWALAFAGLALACVPVLERASPFIYFAF